MIGGSFSCGCCGGDVEGWCMGCSIAVASPVCSCNCPTGPTITTIDPALVSGGLWQEPGDPSGPRIDLVAPRELVVDVVFVPVHDAHWLAELVDPPGGLDDDDNGNGNAGKG